MLTSGTAHRRGRWRPLGVAALLALAVIVWPRAAVAQEQGEVALFDGQSLDNWTAVLSEPGLKKEDVWSVAGGGVLVCKGRGRRSGYIRSTLGDFENYTLRLQWRFPTGTPGGNSGVLVHTTTPNALNVWPKSLEAQLNHQNAGDIWVIGTTCKIENAAERVQGRRHFNLTDDSEKPIGEWNEYEIICDGDEITIKVNGVLVNHVTKCSSSKGAICLQAEGADIEFRNIRLTPLKK